MDDYKEAPLDIFPALHKYKQDHTEINLKKLCVEVAEFVRCIYASTTSESERELMCRMLQDLPKKNGV